MIIVAVTTTEEQPELRQHRNGAGDRRRDRHGQSIMIFNMGELVCDHAGELVLSQLLEQTGRSSYRRMPWIASSGKRVRLRIVHKVHARHRQPSAVRKLPHQADKTRCGVLIDFLGPVHGKHDPVGVPIGEEIHAARDQKGKQRAIRPADEIAHPHE